jgi:hypothetical protein
MASNPARRAQQVLGNREGGCTAGASLRVSAAPCARRLLIAFTRLTSFDLARHPPEDVQNSISLRKTVAISGLNSWNREVGPAQAGSPRRVQRVQVSLISCKRRLQPAGITLLRVIDGGERYDRNHAEISCGEIVQN